MGARYCANQLKLNINQIQEFARRNNLKVLDRSKVCLHYRSLMNTAFDPKSLTSLDSLEASYVLGFLWADGSIGNSKKCAISLEIVSEDMFYIKPILNKLGSWKYYERQRMNWKPITSARINNRSLYQFLVECGYKDKSYKSAKEIIELIPPHLRKYFFRGLIDGDGSFYYNSKQYLRQFNLSSSYEQDWSYFSELLNELDIKYSIQYTERINKLGKINKSSCVRIVNKDGLKKLHNYLYSDYDYIGLPRKYEISKIISE